MDTLRLNGVGRIAIERQRQIEEEGWSLERDRAIYPEGELAMAATVYACLPAFRNDGGHDVLDLWPWEEEWWKPSPENRIRELEKAGALIAAEIDRLAGS